RRTSDISCKNFALLSLAISLLIHLPDFPEWPLEGELATFEPIRGTGRSFSDMFFVANIMPIRYGVVVYGIRRCADAWE
ncbi:MAG: hypothetical protein ABWZ39_11235, partial [Pseudomonas caspiana]